MIYSMKNPEIRKKLTLGAHAFNPGVGLSDIITDKQDPKEFQMLHVHLSRGDIISERYVYQDNHLGHVTHKNFHAKH